MDDVCYSDEFDCLKVELRQTGMDEFTVISGRSRKKGLVYNEAALALGKAIMTRAACLGVLVRNTERRG